MAAFAPIPIARVKAAITANPGLRCKTRQPYWTSCQNVSMPTPFLPVAKRGYSCLLITRCLLTFSLTYLVGLIAQTALPRSAQMQPPRKWDDSETDSTLPTSHVLRHARLKFIFVSPRASAFTIKLLPPAFD